MIHEELLKPLWLAKQEWDRNKSCFLDLPIAFSLTRVNESRFDHILRKSLRRRFPVFVPFRSDRPDSRKNECLLAFGSNYRVSVSTGYVVSEMKPKCAIIDTGAGRSFFDRYQLPVSIRSQI